MRLYDNTGKPSRSIIFIGDSYQKGTNNNNISFLTYFKEFYASEFNAIYNNQEGGYGFAKANYRFITLIKALEGQVGNPKKITDIVVTGGYNDYNNPSGINTAIMDFMAYVKATYPNAEVWLAPVGWTKNITDKDRRSTVREAITNWTYFGPRYGARVITNLCCLFRDPTLLVSDKTHPTDDGHRRLARYMYESLWAGSCEVIQPSTNVGFVATSGITASPGIFSWARNGLCTVAHPNRTTFNFSSARTIKCTGTNDDIIDLGTVPNSKTYGYGWASATTVISNGTHINVVFQLDGTSNFINVDCMVFIRHGHLYLSAYDVPATGGFRSFKCRTFYLPPFEFSVNNFFG